MQMTGGRAVLVANIAADNGAEPFHIEVGVLDFERVEGPLDELDSAGDRVFALADLQASSHAQIPVFGKHAQHVTVQVITGAGFDARDGETERDHSAAVVCAESLA